MQESMQQLQQSIYTGQLLLSVLLPTTKLHKAWDSMPGGIFELPPAVAALLQLSNAATELQQLASSLRCLQACCPALVCLEASLRYWYKSTCFAGISGVSICTCISFWWVYHFVSLLHTRASMLSLCYLAVSLYVTKLQQSCNSCNRLQQLPTTALSVLSRCFTVRYWYMRCQYLYFCT